MSTDKKHTVLKVEDLSIGYKSKKNAITVAEKISFQIEKGELVAIVGANGIGKSTLLRTLANIQPSLSGGITLNKKPIQTYSPLTLATEISVVLTEHIPAKNLNVAEVIALGRQPYTNWVGKLSETDQEKVREVIDLMDLDSMKHKKCFELSDGQLQKVMIARALAQDTSLVILDEPTTHLDIYHKVSVLKLLKKIAHQTQKAVLFSTHEIDLAIQLADKILILHPQGSVLDSPENLIKNDRFQHLFPKGFVEFDTLSGSFKVKKDD
ncbi:ABC transporter ATP-binding protein [Galbibacter sp. EGI 63066]|uniref:ABC transporter ATP-binding protein n=1 Tax=Galbibacter sp. EGI 63066 TaxID=2993559 RepID=UPI002248D9D7|nr:ABC transporter ATP-binding protein [Galbibacter sp. EGI 63066]MCX2678521.1 ABC transporter ATP-binding protein [Galbibacter sp. EGI 63066]